MLRGNAQRAVKMARIATARTMAALGRRVLPNPATKRKENKRKAASRTTKMLLRDKNQIHVRDSVMLCSK